MARFDKDLLPLPLKGRLDFAYQAFRYTLIRPVPF
jgi:hypothetical protein